MLIGSNDPDWERPLLRVLVAYSGSAASRAALDRAVELARHDRAHLTVLSVVPWPSGVMAIAGFSQAVLLQELLARLARELQAIIRALPDDLSITTRVLVGNPAREIISVIGREPFDAVFLGFRPRCGLRRIARSTVASRVLRRCRAVVVTSGSGATTRA
jgi:nucleotide-binding universal stress UspA family protein